MKQHKECQHHWVGLNDRFMECRACKRVAKNIIREAPPEFVTIMQACHRTGKTLSGVRYLINVGILDSQEGFVSQKSIDDYIEGKAMQKPSVKKKKTVSSHTYPRQVAIKNHHFILTQS